MPVGCECCADAPHLRKGQTRAHVQKLVYVSKIIESPARSMKVCCPDAPLCHSFYLHPPPPFPKSYFLFVNLDEVGKGAAKVRVGGSVKRRVEHPDRCENKRLNDADETEAELTAAVDELKAFHDKRAAAVAKKQQVQEKRLREKDAKIVALEKQLAEVMRDQARLNALLATVEST